MAAKTNAVKVLATQRRCYEKLKPVLKHIPNKYKLIRLKDENQKE
jgi:hypothetical protein